MTNFNFKVVNVKSPKGVCIVCNTEVNAENYKASLGSRFCSWPCYEKHKVANTKPNCKCVICNKEMYVKPSRLERTKNGITCSKECTYKLKANYMSGEGNHQYGLKGDLNSSFVGEKRINQYGYVMIYLPNHPKADITGRYREHRYVIEQSNKYSDEYFDIINGQKVLKDCYTPHHINEDKTDNRIENLIIMTRSEHTTLHNLDKEIIRDEDNGRIIGVVKKGELRENLEEDNPEPSITNELLSSNEGAEHSN